MIVKFDADIIEEIKEAESRRPSVETGKIDIDKAQNWLLYDDMAAVVNVSALSIKKLYSQHHTSLLARNLRYHVAGTNVDRGIEDSINNDPELFWLKNNGITIICSDFELDGKEVKLKDFSIVNGGQTTYKLARNKKISESYNFYLPCKIIRLLGDDDNAKSDFSLEIAKSTNTQKAIKPSDLKANAPEQIRFSQAMRDVGIFYQTKRGEEIPNTYKAKQKHSDIAEIGKLCLTAVFQMPCSSRNKPSTIYLPQYYDTIFDGNQQLIAKLCKELLYIDYYYRNTFLRKYLKEVLDNPNSEMKAQFANNARTVCTAFVVLMSRVVQGNLTTPDLELMFSAAKDDRLSDTEVYNRVKNLTNVNWILPPDVSKNMDKYDDILYRLFDVIIQKGSHDLMMITENDKTINASNYLKKDKSYFDIIRRNWDSIWKDSAEILEPLKKG